MDRPMRLGENTVYALVALLLFASALASVGAIAYHLVADLDDGVLPAVTEALDGLLLVFILVELFGAVRTTVAERVLVAEPFLVVGIIAAIKEIVVGSLKAERRAGRGVRRAGHRARRARRRRAPARGQQLPRPPQGTRADRGMTTAEPPSAFAHAVASFDPTSTGGADLDAAERRVHRSGVGAWPPIPGCATSSRPDRRRPVRSRTTRSRSTSTDSTPATTYWYRFRTAGDASPVGRTRTLPGRGRRSVPPGDGVLRPLLGRAARRLPRGGRARGRPRPPSRRLPLRGRRLARAPEPRPAALRRDARRLPTPHRPDPARPGCAGPAPAPPDGRHLGRPRSQRQRVARRRQAPRSGESTGRGRSASPPRRGRARSGSRRGCAIRTTRRVTWRSVPIGDLAELVLLDTRYIGPRPSGGRRRVARSRRPRPFAAR